MDKRFLGYQIIIEEPKNNWSNEIPISCVVRNVGATNENEALGKFINSTKDIVTKNMKIKQKLNPIIFELDTLIKID